MRAAAQGLRVLPRAVRAGVALLAEQDHVHQGHAHRHQHVLEGYLGHPLTVSAAC